MARCRRRGPRLRPVPRRGRPDRLPRPICPLGAQQDQPDQGDRRTRRHRQPHAARRLLVHRCRMAVAVACQPLSWCSGSCHVTSVAAPTHGGGGSLDVGCDRGATREGRQVTVLTARPSRDERGGSWRRHGVVRFGENASGDRAVGPAQLFGGTVVVGGAVVVPRDRARGITGRGAIRRHSSGPAPLANGERLTRAAPVEWIPQSGATPPAFTERCAGTMWWCDTVDTTVVPAERDTAMRDARAATIGATEEVGLRRG